MKQLKTYQFKLKPTKTQEQVFGQWLGTCRYVYNLCLDYKKTLYEHHKISVSKNDIQKELSKIASETEWIGGLHSQTLQEVTDRLYKSYDNFFRGSGFPKFAKKNFYSSFAFKQGVKVLANVNVIQLPKLGKIRFRKSREVQGNVKTASVIKKVDGWYISLSCEVEIESLPKSNNSIGIDVGISTLATLSNGEKIENPKHTKKYEYKLRKLQRSVSRRKKGSANRKKAIKKLALCHQQISNTRKDYLHKVSTTLIRENQSIAVEDLQISNMLKNHKLAKSIADASWNQFFGFLEYKAKWYGRDFEKVSPRNTSKTCSCCGFVVEKMLLAVRVWQCPVCQIVHDRDINAGVNIKNRRAYGVSLGVIQLQ